MHKTKQVTAGNYSICKPARKYLLTTAVGLALSIFLSASGAFASLISAFPSWEVASEFNDFINPDTMNPSGVWSYGWKPTTFGTFSLLGFQYTLGANDGSGWTFDTGYPIVAHNVHAVTLLGSGPQATLPPHALFLHPGPAGELAVVRFTAPAKGTYRVSGQFYAMDRNGTGTITDVYIVKNNTSPAIYSGNVNYYATPNMKFASFTSIAVTLNMGEYIEFQVGFGTDLNYSFDTTGLNAVIEKIR